MALIKMKRLVKSASPPGQRIVGHGAANVVILLRKLNPFLRS